MKIVILGGGFLGKNLALQLEKNGHNRVAIFSRSFEKLDDFRGQWIVGDYKKEDELRSVLRGSDVVFHTLSSSFNFTYFHNPKGEVEENLLPFLNFLHLCREEKIKRIRFVSSAGTIYASSRGSATEESIPTAYSPYGITKLSMEYFLHHWSLTTGGKFDVFRLTNPYGPYQSSGKGQGVIAVWLENIKNNRPLLIYGDGSVARDFIFIDDVVKMLSAHLRGEDDLDQTSELLNISFGQSYSLKEILNILKNIVGKPISIVYDKKRAADTAVVEVNNEKILSWMKDDTFKLTPLEEGLDLTWKFLRGK